MNSETGGIMSINTKKFLTVAGILVLATTIGNYLGTFLGERYVSAACYREPIEPLGAAYYASKFEIVVSDGCDGIHGPIRLFIYFATIVAINILVIMGYFLIKKYGRKK